MATTQLTALQVQPNFPIDDSSTTNLNELIDHGFNKKNSLLSLQPRLSDALSIFCDAKKNCHRRFMLLKGAESESFFSLLQHSISSHHSEPLPYGFAYHFNDNKVTISQAKNDKENFSIKGYCLAETSLDSQILFGCVRQPENQPIRLQPGLVHHANEGILILGLRSLLSQPTVWARLKRMVIKKEFEWMSTDDSHPLPIAIPPLPLNIRIILVGDRISLAELQDNDPELYQSAMYSEFENELYITTSSQINAWLAYVQTVAVYQSLPRIEHSAYSLIIREGVRFTGDQHYLPLSVDWINNLLIEASHYSDNIISGTTISDALKNKNWRENHLFQRLREDLYSNQININTKDHIIGQINALSVTEFPGYPVAIGEPSRLSCIIHYGDGEFIDIERKTELAGNIHAKGMMIMHAFIMSEFAIQQQLPFSISMVFEQSYTELDGDSASLAALCAVMSALSGQAIDQQLAVTGSVDQFGHVQPIGGVNEKIEGFFSICKKQGLTGQQGVIIPAANQRHLCLNNEVIDAIEQQQFSIMTVDNVADALYLLTGIAYRSEKELNLYGLIQNRIQHFMHQDKNTENWLVKLLKSCKKS